MLGAATPVDIPPSHPGGGPLRSVLQSRTAASQPFRDDAGSTSGQLLPLIAAGTSVLTHHTYFLFGDCPPYASRWTVPRFTRCTSHLPLGTQACPSGCVQPG